MSTPAKIIVILGPTASGKSELAVKLARKFNGEIISADSRQIYKWLDIGSGKITKKEMRGVPHHCIDIVSPKKVFSMVEYKQCAEKAIKDILSRGKAPIVCGGTGFYIQAIVDNIVLPEIAPNWKLRKKLEKIPVEKLFLTLKKLDPERAKNIDAKNPRRLIRAIEVAKFQITKSKLQIKPKAQISNFPNNTIYNIQNTNYNFLQIGIKPSDEILKKNIAKRIKKMLADGLIKETKKLHESVAKGGPAHNASRSESGKLGLSWKRINELGFEYRYPALFLQGKISTADMLNKMILENWRYAKRQMTWFKRDKSIKWIDAPDFKKAEKIVRNFL